jgi:hypothetical protein
MKKQLAEALINKGIMKPGTLLYGYTQTSGLGQTLQTLPLELMMEEFDGTTFYCRDRLGKNYTMHINDVQEVDGMEPTRLASVFNIKANGENKIAGKKRGRKPKVKTTQLMEINTVEGEIHGKDKRTEDNIHIE